MQKKLWYKDAIIYQTHVKSFFDSTGDGIGNFNGLNQKLSYLKDLGITALWLMPFYPSPQKDDGYDISDYYNVHSIYGTLSDFKKFLNSAHDKNIKIITELVINHTSDQHEWFKKSRNPESNNPYRDYYVWSNTPEKYKDARIIFKDFENSNWSYDRVAKAYYWHRFYSHQPDLNFNNKNVQNEILKIVDFWFSMGVDGMRLDAIPYLFEKEGTNCENLPETHAYIKILREYVNEKYPDKMLLAEANQWPEDAVAYFGEGDECHMAFHFPLMPRMFIALQMEDAFPIIDMIEQTPKIPENCQWATFLRNHDELTLEMVTDEERDYMYRVYASDPKARINLGIRRRLAPLLNNNRRKIELLNFLLFSLPGTPIIYYGDEIGMGDNYYLGDRNGVRTPMQWSSDKNAGFSKVNPQKLYLPVIIDPEYHYETVNVENQEKNLSSLLWWTRRVIDMRKRYEAFSHGNIQFINSANSKILSFIREYNNEMILIIINLSRFTQVGYLNLIDYYGYIPIELFGQDKFPKITEKEYTVTLGPYDHFWLKLEKDTKTIKIKTQIPDFFKVKTDDWLELFITYSDYFEKELFPSYLNECRWFRGKQKRINRCKIKDKMIFTLEKHKVILFHINLSYANGEPETYMIPLTALKGAETEYIKQNYPSAVILKFIMNDDEYILYDALYETQFHLFLLSLIFENKNITSEDSNLTLKGRIFNYENILKIENISHSQLLKIEQSNTSILFDNKFFLKTFRKFEPETNIEMEMNLFLTTKNFKNIPNFIGSISYESECNSEKTVWGILQEFIPSQGDAWLLTLNEIKLYFERVLSCKNDKISLPNNPTSYINTSFSDTCELIKNLIGSFYAERACLLGSTTANMHKSLIDYNNDIFAPEEFSNLYQRSLYQSMRVSVRKTISLLTEKSNSQPASIRFMIDEIINSETIILEKLKKLISAKVDCIKLRVHGDYHLGQILYSGKDFFIIDFEGEPIKTISERKIKRTAVKDLAGMVRSFQYAIYHTLYKSKIFRDEDIPYLQPWGELWYEYIYRFFLKGYSDEVKNINLLPSHEESFAILLESFLIDKLFYEINYELNNRPDWLEIPIIGLKYMLKQTS